MSRRPGIAYQWYEDHPDIYEYDLITLKTPKGGKLIKPPRYFDKLYDIEDPVDMAKIKKYRESFAKQDVLEKLKHTSYNYLEMLQVEEDHKKSCIRALQRRLD